MGNGILKTLSNQGPTGSVDHWFSNANRRNGS
jgi:hypothetical protein